MTSPAHRPVRPTAEQVAAMLDQLAAADADVADTLDRLLGRRCRVDSTTVQMLERLLSSVRPAAGVRQALAQVDRDVLAAGIRWRVARQERLRLVGGGAL